MPLVLVFIGAIVLVSAIRNTQADLGAALRADVPHYLVWASAIFAVGAIGFIPRMKPISRALMALVITVILFRNYQAAIAGFRAVAAGSPATVPPQTPAAATVATAAQRGASITGTATAAGTPSGAGAAAIVAPSAATGALGSIAGLLQQYGGSTFGAALDSTFGGAL